MSDDLINPKMDRAFALETIDAYPADQPPTSSSDRFWFEAAARFLAADVAALERELAEARQAVEVYGLACAKALNERDAARAELAHAQQQYRDLHASYTVNVADHAAEVERLREALPPSATTIQKQRGAAPNDNDASMDFRAGYMYGEEDEQRAYPLGIDAAWSRYQQERREP